MKVTLYFDSGLWHPGLQIPSISSISIAKEPNSMPNDFTNSYTSKTTASQASNVYAVLDQVRTWFSPGMYRLQPPPSLPALCLHTLDLLHGLLERESEQLPPPLAPELFPHSTLAHVKPLLVRLLLDLVGVARNLQVANGSGKVNATLRLNVNLTT